MYSGMSLHCTCVFRNTVVKWLCATTLFSLFYQVRSMASRSMCLNCWALRFFR